MPRGRAIAVGRLALASLLACHSRTGSNSFANQTEAGAMGNEEMLASIRRGYPALRLGQTQDEVRTLLGPPTRSRALYAKESSATRGTSFEYQVEVRGGAPNVNDATLTLTFDESGRLLSAFPQNISGLDAIGPR